MREVQSFDINGKVISFESLISFLEDENPLVEDNSFYTFPQYNLSLYIDWDKKIFNEVLIYDKILKGEYEKSSFLTYKEIQENQRETTKRAAHNLYFIPYTAVGNFKFGTDPQLFSEKNNFNIPKEISAKQVIKFDENILVRFDKNKLTQVVISNKNTSILYNDLKLFSKDVLENNFKSL